MKKLVNGILEFRKTLLSVYREKYAHLALGQFPDALFIACSDSRVVPNLFASTDPGDLFVLRNVGNLIPPHDQAIHEAIGEVAVIDFALMNLPIKDIVVCGHSECGAMQAIIQGLDKIESSSLKNWLQYGSCTKESSPLMGPSYDSLSPHNKLAQRNILQQISHLKSYPLIQKRIRENQLKIHGWYFDIATGDVYDYEEGFKNFIVIDEKGASTLFSRLK